LKDELLKLTRALRSRVQQSHESDFGGAAAPKSIKSSSKSVAVNPTITGEKKSLPKKDALSVLSETVSACRRCPLGAQRLNPVFGVGSPTAQVLFIGEGPGFEEDRRGEPFVGRSGQLLDKIMESIGLSRETVYIANIVKCHPMKDPSDPDARGNDRPPTPEEIAACRPYLDEQIRAIAPRVIVTLGAVAARVLLEDAEPITKIRGKWRDYTPAGSDRPIKLLPTFHPAALLRNPDLKKDVWADMKALRAALNKEKS
jgi:uracil-DNA glycosylase